MKYELYTYENKIPEDKYKSIYPIIIDNFLIRKPELTREEVDTEESFNKWVNTILNTKDYNIIILYNNDSLIGFGAYMYIERELCLSEIQIKKEYQGKGYLKHLLRFIINNTDKDRYDNIFGTINNQNKLSQNVFTHIGMKNTIKNRYEISKESLNNWIN